MKSSSSSPGGDGTCGYRTVSLPHGSTRGFRIQVRYRPTRGDLLCMYANKCTKSDASFQMFALSVPGYKEQMFVHAHAADVHGAAAAYSFNDGVQTFGGAEQSLGLLDVVLLLGLQSCFHVLLLPALQEFQLLHSWRPKEDN